MQRLPLTGHSVASHHAGDQVRSADADLPSLFIDWWDTLAHGPGRRAELPLVIEGPTNSEPHDLSTIDSANFLLVVGRERSIHLSEHLISPRMQSNTLAR